MPANATTHDAFANISRACTDIESCRTVSNIVLSCLATIFACAWTAVHRNIARPSSDIRSRVLNILDMAKVIVVTLLAPEWVLACAVRQYLNARGIAKELELVRGDAQRAWTTKRQLSTWPADAKTASARKTSNREDTSASDPRDGLPLLSTGDIYAVSGESPQKDEAGGLSAAEIDEVKRLSAKWTFRHGFFLIMGGFHFYEDGEPIHPIDCTDVIALVKAGELIPPTEDEIRAMGQADALSKGLAVVQTLWFVAQATARRAEHLPMAQMETMTLAYATVTIAMYIAWWGKPLNVGGPIRFAGTLPASRWRGHPTGALGHIVNLVVGDHDREVDLRAVACVPAFYGGGGIDNANIRANVVSLLATTGFGAIHAFAWRYIGRFPSHAEGIIWRVCTIMTTALPGWVCMCLLWRFSAFGTSARLYFTNKRSIAVISFIIIFTAAYVLARLTILTLAFTTLWSLPAAAYKSIPWTHFIPHLS
ncbi:hypothetical protein FA95DRAFT_1566282 [Auriscalpium vulgare]|uniref:Uncharacterized protein n=1 Tax=Auriscalpium vulgare TaxID=40419 RepID=A0ACB8R8Z1_9AGAM|nr:hypothetical protein FA95DRAFT_1566282 [Auriscalpium vulgare]